MEILLQIECVFIFIWICAGCRLGVAGARMHVARSTFSFQFEFDLMWFNILSGALRFMRAENCLSSVSQFARGSQNAEKWTEYTKASRKGRASGRQREKYEKFVDKTADEFKYSCENCKSWRPIGKIEFGALRIRRTRVQYHCLIIEIVLGGGGVTQRQEFAAG